MAHFIDGFTSTEYKKHTEIKLTDSCCKKTRYELGENLPILVQVMGGGRCPAEGGSAVKPGAEPALSSHCKGVCPGPRWELGTVCEVWLKNMTCWWELGTVCGVWLRNLTCFACDVDA